MQEEILTKLHDVLLEILDEFVRICEINNLTYLISGGTLLGAVRHKGFIPWDDDVDVDMPRADYEKFIKIFNNIENSRYYLLFMQNPAVFPWIKLCKKNTIYAEHGFDQAENEGIFIDIWPQDNVFIFLLPLQRFLISLASKLYRIKTNTDKTKEWYIKYPLKILSLLVPIKFCVWFPEKLRLLFRKFNTSYVVDFSTWDNRKTTFKANSIFPLIKLPFEGKYYNAPWDYDYCLRTQYGNYTELPPLEKQIAHIPEYIIFDTTIME